MSGGFSEAIHSRYRGFEVVVTVDDILVLSPDGDLAYFGSMRRVRLWVRRKRRELRLPGNG